MRIDKNKCLGCGVCSRVCTLAEEHIITPERDKKDGHIYYVVNEKECVECGVCRRESHCPADALYVQPMDYPRVIRNQFSDPKVLHPKTNGGGRGTEEMKTNELLPLTDGDDNDPVFANEGTVYYTFGWMCQELRVGGSHLKLLAVMDTQQGYSDSIHIQFRTGVGRCEIQCRVRELYDHVRFGEGMVRRFVEDGLCLIDGQTAEVNAANHHIIQDQAVIRRPSEEIPDADNDADQKDNGNTANRNQDDLTVFA